LYNTRAITVGLRNPAMGAKAFDRVTGRRDGTLWYCREIAEVFAEHDVPMAGELQGVVDPTESQESIIAWARAARTAVGWVGGRVTGAKRA